MQETKTNDKLLNDFTENYIEKIFYFCLKKTGSSHEAEDLTSDICINVINALNKGIVPVSFPAYIWQIAHNRYSAWAERKHKYKEAVADCDIDDYISDYELITEVEKLMQSEDLSVLRRELAFIASDYRNLILAYYIEGRKIKDIAADVKLPEGTIMSKIHRARKILKEGMCMAREFGKRSYNPENIYFHNICNRTGATGQPQSIIGSLLHKNIFIEGYDDPKSAKEYALELGVALPYMWDTLEYLTVQTFMVKNNNKYETAFPIISKEASNRIHVYYSEVMPDLVKIIEVLVDISVKLIQDAGISLYDEHLRFEDVKWVLLKLFYKGLYESRESSPKKSLGNTKRPYKGEWDIIGFEISEYVPGITGSCYAEIERNNLSLLSRDEMDTLKSIAKGEEEFDTELADKLVEYGYVIKQNNTFKPAIFVIRTPEFENISQVNFAELVEPYKESIVNGINITRFAEIIDGINAEVRKILCDDLPGSMLNNNELLDSLLNTIASGIFTQGYVTQYALKDGWLEYNEKTSPAAGAYIVI